MESARIIKPLPTFELPKQFLVWVTQKVLAFSDLNLLLTEYYKERLNLQSKNEKRIHMTDQTSTKLTQPQLPTNWTSRTNLLSATLFFLIPLPSTLLLSPSVNFPTPFASYYNSSCLCLNLEHNICPGHSAVTLSLIGTME